MSLMLLSQASLFAEGPIIGTTSGEITYTSGDGNVIIAYSNTGDFIRLFRKVSSGWNTRTLVLEPGALVKSAVLNYMGDRVILSYYLQNGATYKIQAFDFNLINSDITSLVSYTGSRPQNIDYIIQDANSVGFVYSAGNSTSVTLVVVPVSGNGYGIPDFIGLPSIYSASSVTRARFKTSASLDLYWYKGETPPRIGEVVQSTVYTFSVEIPTNAGFVDSKSSESQLDPIFVLANSFSVKVCTPSALIQELTVPHQNKSIRQVFLSPDSKKLAVLSNDFISLKWYITLFSMNSLGDYVLVGSQETGVDGLINFSANKALSLFARKAYSGTGVNTLVL